MTKSILVVEDDEILAENIRTYLERNGWDAIACESAEKALDLVDAMHPDAVVTDHSLPGMTGLELIVRLHIMDPAMKVIMMTGDGSVQCAVDAMKAGACDYLTKPVALAELKMVLEKAFGAQRIEKTLSFYQDREAQGGGLAAMIGTSRPMQAMKSVIRQLLDAESRMSDTDLPVVLITGETGAGKELVARALHFEGARRDEPFVELNCATIPSHLLEAELFGHEKGAFTDARERRVGLVEAASGGTLFLDEVGEIDLALQSKLLKLLEERTIRRLGSVKEIKVNLRIISATNRNLEEMVREGLFRSDLYFRLRIISIKVPPLRERGPDIVTLARHFLEQLGRRYGKHNLRFTAEAESILMEYDWPGNVRELRNSLEQTVLLANGKEITPCQLAICPGLEAERERIFDGMESYCMSTPPDGIRLTEVERDLVIKTLERTDWNVTKSARMLGLTRDMMRYRIEKLGLKRPG